eukprot:Plantae.Rhodophyta-Hildenbrandia_rubra.ctg6124.p1 GENE.Plantae.Rhodophyta-Hildenbrandia_rubra.ctg6124~~Plantae.Rhodophyta-Hildenbrandia_rubra.ctg6124.p1  ORF type:complete len:1027 (+),score=168.71 Plantae.Rhodophyta-Hildenbrandia_rubra.ctg6124:2314-5394(+)
MPRGRPRGRGGRARGRPRLPPRDPNVKPPSMSECFRMRCAEMIDKLLAKDVHLIFHQPVDVNAVPGYLDDIKNPMDLGTCKAKLLDCKYNTLAEFRKDVDLIWSNCLLFNGPEPTNVFSKKALQYREYTEKLIVSLRKGLERDKKALLKWKARQTELEERRKIMEANGIFDLPPSCAAPSESTAAPRFDKPSASPTSSMRSGLVTESEISGKRIFGRPRLVPAEDTSNEQSQAPIIRHAPYRYKEDPVVPCFIPRRKIELAGAIYEQLNTKRRPNPCRPVINSGSIKVKDYVDSLMNFVVNAGDMASKIVNELVGPELDIKQEQENRKKRKRDGVNDDCANDAASAGLSASQDGQPPNPKRRRQEELNGLEGLARVVGSELAQRVAKVPVSEIDFSAPYGVDYSTLTSLQKLAVAMKSVGFDKHLQFLCHQTAKHLQRQKNKMRNAGKAGMAQHGITKKENHLSRAQSSQGQNNNFISRANSAPQLGMHQGQGNMYQQPQYASPHQNPSLSQASMLQAGQMMQGQVQSGQVQSSQKEGITEQGTLQRAPASQKLSRQKIFQLQQQSRNQEQLRAARNIQQQRMQRMQMMAAAQPVGGAQLQDSRNSFLNSVNSSQAMQQPSQERQGIVQTPAVTRGSVQNLLPNIISEPPSTAINSAYPQNTSTSMQSRPASDFMTSSLGPCANCGTSNTTAWRPGATKDQILCNSCGLYWAKHNKQRSPRKERSYDSSRSNPEQQVMATSGLPQGGMVPMMTSSLPPSLRNVTGGQMPASMRFSGFPGASQSMTMPVSSSMAPGQAGFAQGAGGIQNNNLQTSLPLSNFETAAMNNDSLIAFQRMQQQQQAAHRKFRTSQLQQQRQKKQQQSRQDQQPQRQHTQAFYQGGSLSSVPQNFPQVQAQLSNFGYPGASFNGVSQNMNTTLASSTPGQHLGRSMAPNGLMSMPMGQAATGGLPSLAQQSVPSGFSTAQGVAVNTNSQISHLQQPYAQSTSMMQPGQQNFRQPGQQNMGQLPSFPLSNAAIGSSSNASNA